MVLLQVLDEPLDEGTQMLDPTEVFTLRGVDAHSRPDAERRYDRWLRAEGRRLNMSDEFLAQHADLIAEEHELYARTCARLHADPRKVARLDWRDRQARRNAKQHGIVAGRVPMHEKSPTVRSMPRRRGAGRPRAAATRRSSVSRDDGDDGGEPHPAVVAPGLAHLTYAVIPLQARS
jgi:hypothetical protein